MTKKQRYSAEEVIKACEKSGGIEAVVAKNLGCTRGTICNYAKRYPTVQRALDQADETLTDAAEAKSSTLIGAGYWPAIKYRLATKGKNRGYAERTEIEQGGELEIVIKHVYRDPNTRAPHPAKASDERGG